MNIIQWSVGIAVLEHIKLLEYVFQDVTISYYKIKYDILKCQSYSTMVTS